MYGEELQGNKGGEDDMMKAQDTAGWAIAPDNAELPEFLVQEDLAQAAATANATCPLFPCFLLGTEQSSGRESPFSTIPALLVNCIRHL